MTESGTTDIIYTKVDEAPELASASLLPIVRRFAAAAGLTVGVRDISLAGRIIGGNFGADRNHFTHTFLSSRQQAPETKE